MRELYLVQPGQYARKVCGDHQRLLPSSGGRGEGGFKPPASEILQQHCQVAALVDQIDRLDHTFVCYGLQQRVFISEYGGGGGRRALEQQRYAIVEATYAK